MPGGGSPQFSPDGRRIVTASEDGFVRVRDLKPAGKVSPEWLPRLADVVAEVHLNDSGVFEPLSADPIEALKQLKDQLNREPADDDWAIWGRWFLADRSTRTISPFSKVTVPEYIENRIKENRYWSLDEAEELALGNPDLLRRITEARKNLPK